MGNRRSTCEVVDQTGSIDREEETRLESQLLVNDECPGYTLARSLDPQNFTLEYVISNGEEDSYGEIVEPKGWVTDVYKANPVILFQHDRFIAPIGKGLKLIKTPEELRGVGKIAAKESEVAAHIWRLMEGDYLRGWSPGWEPLEWHLMADPKVKGTGFPPSRQGTRFTKQLLLEVSSVTIPSNRDALSQAFGIVVAGAQAAGLKIPETRLPEPYASMYRCVRLVEEHGQGLREKVREPKLLPAHESRRLTQHAKRAYSRPEEDAARDVIRRTAAVLSRIKLGVEAR